MAIDYIADWTTRLRGRLYTQFRGKVTWEQWVVLLGALAQDWEDAAQTLDSLLDIDSSEGVQLDLIGRLIGQPRYGYDDDAYRPLLRARVYANRSVGTPEDLYKVFRALFDLALRYQLEGSKQFTMTVLEPITAAQAAVGVDFLGDSKEAAARGILVWQESADEEMFYTGTGAAIIAGVTTADGVLTFVSSAIFAPYDPGDYSAQVIVEPGTARQETLFFARLSGIELECTTTFAFDHDAGAWVEVVGGPGLGLGDEADATAGGKLAGAAEA